MFQATWTNLLLTARYLAETRRNRCIFISSAWRACERSFTMASDQFIVRFTRRVNCSPRRCSRSIYPNLRGVFRTGDKEREEKNKRCCAARCGARGTESEKKARSRAYMYIGCKATGWAQRHVPGSTTHWLRCNFQWTIATATVTARCITRDALLQTSRHVKCDARFVGHVPLRNIRGKRNEGGCVCTRIFLSR